MPRKSFIELHSCTGWPLAIRKSRVLTCLSCTVSVGVVHQVPRSSIRTRSGVAVGLLPPRSFSLWVTHNVDIVPPKPLPITTMS